jgi:hypothetical protein
VQVEPTAYSTTVERRRGSSITDRAQRTCLSATHYTSQHPHLVNEPLATDAICIGCMPTQKSTCRPLVGVQYCMRHSIHNLSFASTQTITFTYTKTLKVAHRETLCKAPFAAIRKGGETLLAPALYAICNGACLLQGVLRVYAADGAVLFESTPPAGAYVAQSGRTVRLKSLLPGCLDSNGGQNYMAPRVLDCPEGTPTTTNQQWFMSDAGDGRVRLHEMSSGASR